MSRSIVIKRIVIILGNKRHIDVGGLLGILGRGVPPPGSQNPGSIADHILFSVLEVVTKHDITCLKTEIMSSLIRRKPQQTDFLKVISDSHITLSSFLELKR